MRWVWRLTLGCVLWFGVNLWAVTRTMPRTLCYQHATWDRDTKTWHYDGYAAVCVEEGR